MILCDAGALLCLVDPKQPKHQAYRQTVAQLEQSLVTTWSCFTEAMYLALHRGGWPMQKQLGNLLMLGLLSIFEIQEGDYSRLFSLMEKYQDCPMDLADGTMVIAAEGLGIRHILTTDSDFLFYRIKDKGSFEVITVD